MPNILDKDGLQIKTTNDIIDSLSTAFRDIYGQDVNLESNTPDGQLINIFAQAVEDSLELILGVYNSFDPDYAVGTVLDQRCAINGIQRRSGTYTYVPVSVIVDRSLTLNGLDTVSEEEAYTVSDAQGNQFLLSKTTNITQAGTISLSFRAKEIGAVEVLPNTITTPITIVLGVSSVNNPSGASSVGVNEETDAALRTRRQISVSISAKGYTDSLKSALLNINNVQSVSVYDNRTNQTDADGIPAHSIWTIIEGGTNEEIGAVMNSKVAGGVGMKGSVSIQVPQADGWSGMYYFDRPTTEQLYISIQIKTIGEVEVDTEWLRSQIASHFTYAAYQTADSASIVCFVSQIQKGISCAAQVSTNGTDWGLVALPVSKQAQFVISPENITITVNGVSK